MAHSKTRIIPCPYCHHQHKVHHTMSVWHWPCEKCGMVFDWKKSNLPTKKKVLKEARNIIAELEKDRL